MPNETPLTKPDTAEQPADEGLDETTCSRFPAARVEELLQASNDLSEGDEISYDDARDLALYALDELERVRNVYQSRFMGIATAAVTAMRYPSENTQISGPSAESDC